MLFTSSLATFQTTLPKLTIDGSNWIVWKTRIQILIRTKKLAHMRKTVDDAEFTSILTNSLPSSYDNVISSAYSAAIAVRIEITIDQIDSVVQEEYARRQISSGNLSTHHSLALFSNPQKPTASRWNQKKKNLEDLCTDQRCRYRHTHEFKDCRSEGGPLHGQNPPQATNQRNATRFHCYQLTKRS